MRFRIKHIRTKVTLLVLVVAAAPGVVMVSMTALEGHRVSGDVGGELNRQGKENLAGITRGVYSLCETQQESLKGVLSQNLNVAQDIIRRGGGIHLLPAVTSWRASNQFTKTVQNVTLPRVAVGATWLGNNASAGVKTPVVDEAAQMVGGAFTIFQRMNAQGDMLRVATNVLKKDRTRAIGTFIPAANEDGTPNPIVAAVLQGKPYEGRAFVVDQWYVAIYKPVMDSSGRVIGMLFTGVRQENVNSLRRGILATTVGKSGYVAVLGGTGDLRGTYIISKGGARDGENVLNATDAKGNHFIEQMVDQASRQKRGEVSYISYPWKNPGDAAPRSKIAALSYFAPWDWVIVTSAYEQEFTSAEGRVRGAMGRLIWILVAATAGAAMLTIWFGSRFAAKQLVHPIQQCAEAADLLAIGDVSAEVTVESDDELGDLARSMRTVVEHLRDQAAAAERIAAGDLTVDVGSSSEKDALGHSMGRVTESLRGLTAETAALSASAVAGHLATRADASQFRGDYRRIVQGVNDTLDAVIGPLNVTAECVDRISKGDIPAKITDNYNGDFNHIKNNLNAC
ncbi:MAG TPA: Cache 3/Cache 2 fusion domain-containing protein, partial [Armatimonadota bacterium]